MRILILSRSLLANAPMHLCNSFNKYIENQVESRCITTANGKLKMPQDTCWPWEQQGGKKILKENIKQFKQLLDWCDIVHIENQPPFMNNSKGWQILNQTKKPIVAQIHSEPNKVKKMYRDMQKHFKIARSLVIAQYHAVFVKEALPDVNFIPVRNIIDINRDELLPNYQNNNKVHVTYSPTVLCTKEKLRKRRGSVWAYKGYPEVYPILDQLEKSGLIKVSIFHETDYLRTLRIRRGADIHIGSIGNGSIHLSDLEALSQGKVLFSEIADWMEEFYQKFLGCDWFPWVQVNTQNLEEKIKEYSSSNITLYGIQSRSWMEEFWNPDLVLNDYLKVYKELV